MIHGVYLNGMTDDISACIKIREEVFGREDTGSYNDVDEMAMHLLLFDHENQPVGTVRLHFDMDGDYRFDYLFIKESDIHKGYADFLMHMLFDKAKQCGARTVATDFMMEKKAYFDQYGFEEKDGEIVLDLDRYFNSRKCCH